MTESNRNSLMLAGDAIRRSMTRNSHYSHASTHSWVISNQQNPPPPPPDECLPSPIRTPRPLPDPLPSPARTTPRPLPDPQLHAQYHQLRTTNADLALVTPEDEEEYMNIDPNLPGMESGYLTEGLGRGRAPLTSSPTAADANAGRERGFVGGFVSGLRRLPRVVLKYRNFGEKRMYFRRTYGSGGTLTNGTITNGTDTVNTLPLYASSPPTPVAGPSHTRYVEALEMPVPHPVEPPALDILGPSLSERRRHPSFRLSPPSVEAVEREHTSAPLADPAQTNPPAPTMPGRNSNAVTIYNLPDQEEYRAEEPSLPLPASTPNRLSTIHSQNPRSPAASIPVEAQPQSPVFAPPPPTSDYLKMTSSSRSPGTMSNSEPSFSSQLSPVKSFLIKLYRLPWIAPERVTEDYRPGSDRRHHASSGVKKHMTSWYRGKPGVVLSIKNGSGEIDLLSSNSSSRRASSGTSSTPLSSPSLHVRHRSSDHERHHSREPRHRTQGRSNTNRNHGRSRQRRNTVVSANDIQPQNNSPMIPAVYPYPYPFPIAYPTFPTSPPPPPQRAQSQSTPRGPRPHRTPTYPHGYVPYQLPPPPPPVFVMHSPAQTASSVEGSPQVMPVYVPTSLVPGVTPTASPPSASFPAPPAGEAAPTGG
ncbi:hypothetical protein C0989_009259 [Termitomyces sp. Mn162]|nr:hypothetical protein C0989_009259 [Termitomyces sp. Mn162]